MYSAAISVVEHSFFPSNMIETIDALLNYNFGTLSRGLNNAFNAIAQAYWTSAKTV